MIRTWAWIVLFATLSLPAIASERVTASQLDRLLAAAQSRSDGELADTLSRLQLTERYPSARAAQWKASMPGARSQRALMGLVDRSAFLDPAGEAGGSAAIPTAAEQRSIMGLAAGYVGHVIPQLPRFYAARTTTHFEQNPASRAGSDTPVDDALRAVRISRSTVLYRDGQEMVDPAPYRVLKSRTADVGLRTWGVFGPILGLVLVDAAQSSLSWARWEESPGGRVAVFRYAVPRSRSHYEVRYCCIASQYGLENDAFEQMSAYHGEIEVNPSNGVIVRLTVEADLEPSDPISSADLMVEYGPVDLGGMTYICPTHSVSISMARTRRNLQDPAGHSYAAMGPSQMLLNHVDFEQYHLFRGDARVLSGDEERAQGITPDATLPKTEARDLEPAEEDLADAPAATPSEPAASSAAEAAAVPGESSGQGQEITTAVATGVPETPLATSPPEKGTAGVTLRINARLVDVNVVALDKKGRPIRNLAPGDFEVYDNGVKQEVRSFMETNTEAPAASAPAGPATRGEFSNHAQASAGDPRTTENTLILLLDGSNLAFPDLVDAREQMVRFLRSLPPTERVALYVMKYHGYQVLSDGTTDHEAVAAQLSRWMPTAQDLANAQDEEKRHRQQIETVHSPEDMLSVNGNSTLDTATQTEALDPKLRELGSVPGPNALLLLVDVAHHLAAMPGHKNLVWVTSDNALADWNKLSFNLDKGSKYIEPIALRAQEAMNNAHVSVYPLDASRLEASVITPEIGRRNVELTPTYQRPALLEQELEGPEATATQDMNPMVQNRNWGNGSRLTAQMQQDTHPIQGVFREVADATGGHVFRRSNNILGELDEVVADGHATYLLGFSPGQPADGQYHILTVKLVGHRDATLRFRSGYQFDKEPTTLKDRFAKAVWQPADSSEIGVSTRFVSDPEGSALRVTVSGADLSLEQQKAVWAGKLDIFLVERDAEALHAKVSGLTVGLHLKQATYERALKEGLTFDERVDPKQTSSSVRVVVVDVNSGRIGSVTVPSSALEAKR